MNLRLHLLDHRLHYLLESDVSFLAATVQRLGDLVRTPTKDELTLELVGTSEIELLPERVVFCSMFDEKLIEGERLE